MSVPIAPLLIAASRTRRWRLVRIGTRLLRHEQDASILLATVLGAVTHDPSALLCAFTMFCRGGHRAAVLDYSKCAPDALKPVAVAALADTQEIPAADEAVLSPPLEEHEIAVAQLFGGCEASVKVPTLVRLLDNPDADIRAAAVRALRLRRRECVDELCALLPGLSVAAKGAVITVLAEIQEPRIAHFLCNQFETGPMSATEMTIRALGSYRTEPALAALMNVALRGKYCSDALEAVAAFGPSGTDAILAAFRNEPTFRRSRGAEVARALQRDALSSLCEALDDPRRVVRDSAEQGLEVLGDAAAAELTRRLLDPEAPTDVHLRGIRLLSRLRRADAMHALLKVAETRHGLERAAAVEALSAYSNSETLNAARAATESTDPRVRAAGQRAFETILSALQRQEAASGTSQGAEQTPIDRPAYSVAFSRRVPAHPIDAWIADHTALHSPEWRPGPVPKADPAISSEVHFSVTAPQRITRRQPFILDVWAHAEREASVVRHDPSFDLRHLRRIIETVGPVFIDKGVRLSVSLSVPDLSFAEENSLCWSGAPANCNFALTTPDDVANGAHAGVVTIRMESVQIARVSFVLEVGDQQIANIVDVTGFDTRALRWFASYASVDRNAVLGRIQGMLKVLPELDVFLDVAALRSGDSWQARLDEEIAARDGLYLFWSPAAMRSTHVDHEWRTAYRLKGLEGINPVPLAPPNVAPPPEELRDLHFNEWTLSFER